MRGELPRPLSLFFLLLIPSKEDAVYGAIMADTELIARVYPVNETSLKETLQHATKSITCNCGVRQTDWQGVDVICLI